MKDLFLTEKMKILVWCMGHMGEDFSNYIKKYGGANIIIGYTDSDKRKIENYKKHGKTFQGYTVYMMEEIEGLDFDCIVIASYSEDIIYEIKEFIVERQWKCLILSGEQAINMIRRNRVIRKYNGTLEPELRETVEWLKEHELTVRNQWENEEKIYYNVQFDKENGNFPYIDFRGKRMYFPKDHKFVKDGEKLYLVNVVEGDQYSGSPHLYIEGAHKIHQGDVIVDAGVAEGNFALSYIDLVSKAYLV